MANKIYIVVKDGEELEKLKTLAAAKKLADAEGAEVYCDGKCVYEGTVSLTGEKTAEAVSEKRAVPGRFRSPSDVLGWGKCFTEQLRQPPQ